MSSGSAVSHRAQVVVIGAGPVGLFAALRLRQQGIAVRLIEQQSQHLAHAFPVVLHRQTLRLLAEVGVSAALFWRGRPVTHLAVYADSERRAVLDLPPSSNKRAGVLTLPQDVLRQALTHELTRQGVRVEWNTRLAVLQQDERSVSGHLICEEPGRAGRLEGSAFEADFVIGADGHESTVREALGLRLVPEGPLRTFAFFDATTQGAGSEAQLALTEDYGNSVYPLQGGQRRFSFQLGRGLDGLADADALRQLLAARMPWYVDDLVSLDWGCVAEFRHALVDRFGVGRAWLAGDAAHLTGPLGVQSLNVGIDEANELALRMGRAIARPAWPAFGGDYDARRRRQWEQLLGIAPFVDFGPRAPDWARRYAARLVSALPASDADADELLAQLRLLPNAVVRRSRTSP